MAKAMVETLVDDVDGAPAAEMIRLGWNGDWREIDLSKRNAAALSRALDRYWAAARPVSVDGDGPRRRQSARSRSKKSSCDRASDGARNDRSDPDIVEPGVRVGQRRTTVGRGAASGVAEPSPAPNARCRASERRVTEHTGLG
jgi:Lsr2